MALSYNLGYQESISVHPTRRQNFAGKPYSNFPNIWQWLIYLSQLVPVCGKYIFLYFSYFQTPDPWFPPKYAPASTSDQQIMSLYPLQVHAQSVEAHKAIWLWRLYLIPGTPNMSLYLIPGLEKIKWHRTAQSTHCALEPVSHLLIANWLMTIVLWIWLSLSLSLPWFVFVFVFNLYSICLRYICLCLLRESFTWLCSPLVEPPHQPGAAVSSGVPL